jgi:hypothetical protein
MDYAETVELLRPTHPDLASEMAPFNTLENVLAWMKKRGISLGALELIAQDEYSHDALIPVGSGSEYVVFGCT